MLWRFPELLERVLSDKRRVFSIEDSEGFLCEGIQPVRSSKIKAWIPVMYGCNNFCTYCIVPYVRGRERSRAAEDIVNEVRSLVAQGYKDFTLLGQNVNSYGRDLGGGTDFADLLKMIDSLEGDFLIRFMTSHPKDATDKLFDTMASCERSQTHTSALSVRERQGASGHEQGYTAEEYCKSVYAQKTVPGLVMTSDVIVGFPGRPNRSLRILSSWWEPSGSTRCSCLFTPREGNSREAGRPFHKGGEGKAV